MAVDLEMFKSFKDKKKSYCFAKIKQLSVASDRSFLKCLVSIFQIKEKLLQEWREQ